MSRSGNQPLPRAHMRWGVLLVTISLLAAVITLLAPTPQSSAQSSPSDAQQEQAAERLLAQLDALPGKVDLGDVSIDPALGPAPWISFVPGRNPATVEAWVELARRTSNSKVDPNAANRFAVGVSDIEDFSQVGLNDAIETGQRVDGFGTNAQDSANITGVLGTPLPPSICPEAEENGSLATANDATFPPGFIDRCEGIIGNGVYGDTSGDIDMYRLGAVEEGGVVIADFVPRGAERGPFSVAIYDDAGTLLASAVDGDGSFLSFQVANAGVYYAAIAGENSLPLDPTNPASGQGQTTVGTYDFFVGFQPEPPPACLSAEPNDAISESTFIDYDLSTGSVLFCEGEIGNGNFGDTSGDFDLFEFSTSQPATFVADAAPFLDGVRLALYTNDGVLLGEFDDVGEADSLVVDVPNPGSYFLSVSAPGHVQTDATTPDTGQGDTTPATYLLAVFANPLIEVDPAPCFSAEPDGSISESQSLPQASEAVARCEGFIGDNPDVPSDFDAYTVRAVGQQNDLVVGTDLSLTAVEARVYNSDTGEEVPLIDIDGYQGLTTQFGLAQVPAGSYTVIVGEQGTALSDPFDATSGPTANEVDGPYLLELGVFNLDGPVAEPAPAPPPQLDPEIADKLADAWANHSPERAARLAQRDAAIRAVLPSCNTAEDNGSIGGAGEAVPPVTCEAFLGDGPYGASSGDFDMYKVSIDAGQFIVADIDAAVNGSPLDSTLTLYDSSGAELRFNDDSDDLDSRLEFQVPATGDYFISVGSYSSTLVDPTDSGSGSGFNTTGDYLLDIDVVDELPLGEGDIDVYLVDLQAGDTLRAGFTVQGSVLIVDPERVVRQKSFGSAALIYPLDSPLRHLGNVGTDHVADVAGTYAVVVTDGAGTYSGELQVIRPGRSEAPGNDEQIVFLDFDGAMLDPAIYDPFIPTLGERFMSPLSDFIPRWGLDASDEDAVIDAIIDVFVETVSVDLRVIGGNGDRDASGIPGEFDIRVLNSRDHDDAWGQENVTRVIIGGTIAELEIGTIGIAQSIDPGNADATESGIVLLDLLSEPAGIGAPTLNDFGVAGEFTKIDLIGQGVGIIAAHEFGHMIGNWHTATVNENVGVMDEGGILANSVGVGPDGVLGTGDDYSVHFHQDEFSFFEGFQGIEDTRIRSGFAMATGQAPADPEVGEQPDPGVYLLQNVGTGRYLDADPGNQVDTSTSPAEDDRWELEVAPDGNWYLRNVNYNRWLDSDARAQVDMSTSPSADDIWAFEPLNNGNFNIRAVQRGGYLTVDGQDPVRVGLRGANSEWGLVLVEDGPAGGLAPGDAVALLSPVTNRWLDTDPNRNVDQSVNQGRDDIWNVVDAGGGTIALRNDATGRYLDADGSSQDWNVETSSSIRDDDRWIVESLDDGSVGLRNLQFGRWLAAGTSAPYNVSTVENLQANTVWQVVTIGGAQ